MYITAVAVDDNPSALEIIKKYADKTPSLSLTQSFTQPLEALDFLDRQSVDVIFIDIEMDDLNGIDFIKITKTKDFNLSPKFVITSAHDTYAIDAYDLNITDYLLKPFAYERFLQALEKVRREKQSSKIIMPGVHNRHLFLRNNGKTIKLRHDDILYVQSDGHFVKVHLKERRYPLMLSYKITQMEEMLPHHSFLRTHKSYIINVEHISEIDSSSVCLESVQPLIPVGGTYRQKIIQLCKALSA